MHLKRSIIEGIKNLVRTAWLSITAITVLTVSVGLISIVYSTRTVFSHLIREADKKATIKILIKDSFSSDIEIKTTENNLKKIDGVKSVEYVPKEVEKTRLEQQGRYESNVNEIFEQLGFNPFLNSFVITPNAAEDYNKILEEIQSKNFSEPNGVQRIIESQEFIDNLTRLYEWTSWGGIIALILFGSLSIIIIIQVLRLIISYFKDEIEIMRLVGATNQYIQGPFVVQGMLFGIISSTIVGLLLFPLTSFVINNFKEWSGSGAIEELSSQLYFSTLLILIFVVVVSAITSYISSRRYLKK